jgi:hypothetical protein
MKDSEGVLEPSRPAFEPIVSRLRRYRSGFVSAGRHGADSPLRDYTRPTSQNAYLGREGYKSGNVTGNPSAPGTLAGISAPVLHMLHCNTGERSLKSASAASRLSPLPPLNPDASPKQVPGVIGGRRRA